uniref:Ski_Sno domain-containing protein n=1 Tax=Heterorhabditis bacteriophora TaxID=37862 RepID=A0A1I7WKB5_HETBA
MSLSPRYLLVQLADGTDIGKLVETLISNGHSRLSLFDNLPGRFDELYGLALGEGNQCPISLFPLNPAHVSNRAVESDCLESKENEATIGNTDGDDLDSTLCHKSDHIHDITLLEDTMKDTEKNTQLLEEIKRDDEE